MASRTWEIAADIMQARGRTLLLSSFPHVESQVPETHFRTSRYFYLFPGSVEDRVGGLFQRAAELSPCVTGPLQGLIHTPASPHGAHSQIFAMAGFKKILSIMLSSVSLLPKFVSYSLEASNFFRLESKPSAPYVKALGQTQCLHSKCKISCGWFSPPCKNS